MHITEPAAGPTTRREQAKPKLVIPLFAGVARDGELPPLSLLQEPPELQGMGGYSEETLEVLSLQVEKTLRDFKVHARVVSAWPGPVITRLELMLAPGVRGSRVASLEKDLARSLSVPSLRVVNVVAPGKNVLGLELPNVEREIVCLSDVLSSRDYVGARSPLSLALGKDVSGRPVVVDLQAMPHLLVAGEAGSGVSTTLNAIVLSLLFKARAADVRLIMIDPKTIELSVYDGIPHLLAPVVTDMKHASNALRWCVAETVRRYKLMTAVGVRDLAGFNRKVSDAEAAGQPLSDPLFAPDPETLDTTHWPVLRPLPCIVVVIDEFADLLMVDEDAKELIEGIAQRGRAADVHLILATQQLSEDIITEQIVADVPARIALRVQAKVDSRTIIDQPGAEVLFGKGDMLYLPRGATTTERVHGAFVSDEDVHRVVEWLRSQSEPRYVDGMLEQVWTTDDPEDAAEDETDMDELYDEAVAIVTSSRRASISGVQRHLRIGYNCAALLIEMMEQQGVVTPPKHNGNRDVLAPPPPRH